jgi:hypothetical protein
LVPDINTIRNYFQPHAGSQAKPKSSIAVVVVDSIESVTPKHALARKAACRNRDIIWVNETLAILWPTRDTTVVRKGWPIHLFSMRVPWNGKGCDSKLAVRRACLWAL